jgi:hypothetical protein
VSIDHRALQAEIDPRIQEIAQSDLIEERVARLAVLLNRTATELHRLARAEANERKGSPEWGAWASLQNTARGVVLQSSSLRDLAVRIAPHEQ